MNIIKASRYGDLDLTGEWEDVGGDPITPTPTDIDVVDNELCPGIEAELEDPELGTFRIFAPAAVIDAITVHTSWFRLRLTLENGQKILSTFRYELHVE